MKKHNKKGFTIVELVIVIAVIAILAAVLIPTFSSVIRKARISNDTQVVRNLNTTLSTAEVTDGKPENFKEVIDILKEDGYVLANLNPTTDGWFYVWESETNQMLLIDEKYDIQYKAKDLTATEPGATWYFAISNETIASNVKKDLVDGKGDNAVKIERPIIKSTDLKNIFSAGGENKIYVDESVVLDSNSLLVLNDPTANLELNLGTSVLSSNGILVDMLPLSIEQGSITINGGVINSAGSYIDSDGERVNAVLSSAAGTNVIVNGSTFISNESGYSIIAGNATLNNAKFDAKNVALYVQQSANVQANNLEMISAGRCFWVCDHTAHPGAELTINSGYYKGGNAAGSYAYQQAPIVTCGGDVIINGGDFVSNTGKIFNIFSNGGGSKNSTITINGGTFNGVAFENVTDWFALCAQEPGWRHVISEVGSSIVISLEKIA